MAWMDRKKLCSYILASLCVVLIVFYILLLWFMWEKTIKGEVNYVDRYGDLVGYDFSHYYAASSLALNSNPALVYNPDILQATIHQIAGVKSHKVYAFLYPPTFLLIILPLSLFPYLAALASWLSVTLVGNLAVLRRIAPHFLTPWLALAFPGTFLNIICGQNGFLSAVFLGGGLLLLDRIPWLGGVLLGLLSYKPHLSVLVPVALIAGRHWKALLAESITVAGILLISEGVFGLKTWSAFWHTLPYAKQLLQAGTVPLQNMPTFFAFALSSGWNLSTTWLLQGIIMVAVAGAVAAAWFKRVPVPIRNAILALGALLFSPYVFHYDLSILFLALAWLGWHGYKEGWFLGERSLLFLTWIAPIASFPFWGLGFKLPFLPLLMVPLFILIVNRHVGMKSLPIKDSNIPFPNKSDG